MKRGSKIKKDDIDKMAASSSSDKNAVYLKCASLYIDIEEYSAALKHVAQYTKSCPKDPKGYKMTGLVNEKMGAVKEALKAYRRCAELNDRDTEAKESVSVLYCQSTSEQLFRKKAWLDKMEKDLPHYTTTHRLKCHVLQESGRTEELEQYLLKQLRTNSLDVETNRALIKMLATRTTDEALYFSCKLNHLLYQELELLQLAFGVVSRSLSSNKLELHMAERILLTCHWVMCSVVRLQREESERKTSWVNFDTTLKSLSANLNINGRSTWEAIARECLSCLWLWVPHVVECGDDMSVACHILALSAPLLDAPHTLTEISLYRSVTAGVSFSNAKRTLSAIQISSIISRHCSSQSQSSALELLTPKSASYCANNILRNVIVPSLTDLEGSLLRYMKVRPRELGTLTAVLVERYDVGEAVPVEDVVHAILPKLKLHAQSLDVTHVVDLCQDDVAALLHLLMKFPKLLSPSVIQFWDDICYSTKIVSSSTHANAALVKKGMWALRALSNHGLGPKEIVTLAKYFSHRAALLFEVGGPHYDKLQLRSAHYWKVSYDVITAIQSRTHKRQNNSLFNFEPLEEAELGELACESALEYAGVLVNEGKFALALAAYQSIETEQAAFNAAQVYLHLEECSSTPRSKAKHRENAELQLQACKERATENQELLKMVSLIEDSMPGKLRYVTKRNSRDDTAAVTPFKEIDAKAKLEFVSPDIPFVTMRNQATASTRYEAVNDSVLSQNDVGLRSSVIKQLDFSPPRHDTDQSEAKITDQLQNMSMSLQKQLEEKSDEVSFLKNELLKLKDEVSQVKSDMCQMNSPRQQPAGVLTPGGILTPGQGSLTHRTATPLWMRNDLPAQQSPGSPLVVHHQSIYPPGAGAYQPGTGAYQPGTGAYQSDTGAYQPGTVAYQPVSGAEQPVSGPYQPVSGAYQPVSGAYQPVTGAYQAGTYPASTVYPTTVTYHVAGAYQTGDYQTMASYPTPAGVGQMTTYSQPSAGSMPNTIHSPSVQGLAYPTADAVPGGSTAATVPGGGTVPSAGYQSNGSFPNPPAGFGLPAYGASPQSKQQYHLLHFNTIPLNKDAPAPEPYSCVPLSDTLEPSTLGETTQSETLLTQPPLLPDMAPGLLGPAPGLFGPAPGLLGPAPGLLGQAPGLLGPAPGLLGPYPGLVGPVPSHDLAKGLLGLERGVLSSTPIVDRAKGAIFDSSSITLPDTLGPSLEARTGKFTCEVSPEEKNKKPPSQSIEPGYFARLLDQKEEEEEYTETGSYHEDSDPETNDLYQSQYFKEGTLVAAQEKLQRSQNSSVGELENSTYLPQVNLTEITEFTSGEEDEICVFDCRAKLYRFYCGEWKERGIGELKLLRSRSSTLHRVVMRRDFVLNICANHLITPDITLQSAFGSDKAWVWFTPADMANEVPEPQQLAARFKTKEIADDFKQAFEEARQASQKIKTLSTVSSPDLEVTWQLKPSEADVTRARAFLLPDTFYQPPRNRCPGCRGCEEDDNTHETFDDVSDDDDVVFVKEVLPPTPLKNLAAQYQLPPYFYNKRNSECTGCIGCLNDDDFHDPTVPDEVITKDSTVPDQVVTTDGVVKTADGATISPACDLSLRPDSPEVVFIKEVLPPTPLKQRAEQFMLPPSFYNVRYGTCKGCAGCKDDADFHDEENPQDEIEIIKEVLPPTPLKHLAAKFKLPLSFYNKQDPCSGCVGCDDDKEDEQEPALTSSLAESYVGCGKSDPNEPVSETPLYDDMWPEDIQEEDKGQFFSPSKQGNAAQVVEVAVLEFGATLSHFDTRKRGYFELGTGTLSILSDQSRVQYRLTFHDSTSLLHASHAIEGGMYVEAVPDSNKFLWFVPIDYTDPETPIPRKFMVELEGNEEGDEFKRMFMECSEKMKGHVVNHKLVSLLAAGSPRKEGKATLANKDVINLAKAEEPLSANLSSVEEKVKSETKPHGICANLKQDFELYSKDMLKSTDDTSKDDTPKGDATPELNEDQDWSRLLDTSYEASDLLNISGNSLVLDTSTRALDTSTQALDTSKPVLDTSKPVLDTSKRLLDTSVEVVKEVLPPIELQAKEAQFSLPKGFYNYMNKSECTGCAGCEGSGALNCGFTSESTGKSVTEQGDTREQSDTNKGGKVDKSVESNPTQITPAPTQNPPAPSLYDALPVFNPAVQDSPFGLKQSSPEHHSIFLTKSPANSPSIFGISPTQTASLAQPSNIFVQNQTNASNLFLQGNNVNSLKKASAEENIFLKSTSKEDNIFLKSTSKEENIFLKSAPKENIFLQSAPKEENIFLNTAAISSAPVLNPFATPPLPAKASVSGEDFAEYEEYEEEDYEDYDDYEAYVNQYEYDAADADTD